MKRKTYQVFAKMPQRDSTVSTPQLSTTIRRSPRFRHPKFTGETDPPCTTLRKSQRLVQLEKSALKSENPRTPKSKPRSRSVPRPLNSPLSSKKSSKANGGSIKYAKLNNVVGGCQSVRRSSRILNQKCVGGDGHKDSPRKLSKNLFEFDNGPSNCAKLSSRILNQKFVGVDEHRDLRKKSVEFDNGWSSCAKLSSGSRECRRKSPRFCIEKSAVDEHKVLPAEVSKKLVELDNGSSNHSKLSSESRECRRKSRRLRIEQSLVDEHDKVSKKLAEFDKGSRNCAKLSSGSRDPRRKSQWFCIEQSVVDADKDLPKKVSKKLDKIDDGSTDCAKLSSGSRYPRRNIKQSVVDEHRDLTEKVSKKLVTVDDVSSNCAKLSSGSREPRIKSRRVCIEQSAVDENKDVPKKVSQKLGKFDNGSGNCAKMSSGSREPRRKSRRVCVEQSVVNEQNKRAKRRGSVGAETVSGEGRERKIQDLDGENKEVGVRRKRKRDEEVVEIVQGWTKEQELALQRAYLVAKPTPHFWKKVSKLVPGKSAQECFDRVHSEHMTPPQLPTRSRAKVLTNSSPLGNFSLSASKLLKPTEIKSKNPSFHKRKSRLGQKIVRKLLQKHYQVPQDYEADLFSVLEPSFAPSTEIQPSVIPSTPKNLQKKHGLLQQCSQRSSSGHKKTLSRFSRSSGTPLVSPPVLKQVRSKFWHEKYIDQLHNREAKRKAASIGTEKSIAGVDDRKKSHVLEVDVVRTAKVALVSDARDAISKLQHLEANAMDNNSDLDDDAAVRDDEEDDDDT